MSFTSDEAFEFQGTDDAIMLSWKACVRIIKEQGCDVSEFHADMIGEDVRLDDVRIDAGLLMGWLGY